MQDARRGDDTAFEPLLLGVDGGGTGCRARLSTAEGRVLGEGQSGPAHLRFGIEEAFQSALDAVRFAFAAADLPLERFRDVHAAFGFAGATEPTLIAAARARPHPFASLSVVADAHTACLGAHGGREGGIVVVGTGSVAWAIVDGKVHRAGGWGFPISDEGSGAWLGLEAVRRMLFAHDGRISSSPLLEEIFDRFERSPQKVVAWMTGARPGDFGKLAPLIVERAKLRDPAALALMQEAGEHVGALARCLLNAGAERVALVGGLARAIQPWLDPALRARLVPPEGDALAGAVLLASAALHHLASA